VNGWAKAGLVAAGYVGAIVIASAVTAAHVAATDPAQASAASGMYAFGDTILFVGVFAIVALLPTAAAVYFLWSGRSHRQPG
jgi:hypothetical protein